MLSNCCSRHVSAAYLIFRTAVPVVSLNCRKLHIDNFRSCVNDRRNSEQGQGHNGYQNKGSRGLGPGLTISGFSLGLLGFFEKKEKLSPEDELLIKIKRGILAMQEGEPQKAERHLGDAWKMSEELQREDVKTQIMDIQANLAYHKGELDRAIRLFQLVTQRMVFHQGVKVTDNSVIEISIKLSQIFAMKGQMAESLAGLQFCVDTQREKIKNGDKDEDTLMLAAWSLQNLAQTYMGSATQGDKVDGESILKATALAKEAHAYASEAVGADSQQAVAISSDLGSILALQGDVDGALKQFEACEKIAEEKHQYLHAALRVNTGSLYLLKGEYSEAQKICKEARMIASMYKDMDSVMKADQCIANAKSAELNSSSGQVLEKRSNSRTSADKS